jgi:WIF domain
MTLVCTGTTTADVDIKLQLNATVMSPTNVTTLDIRRKKTCIRGIYQRHVEFVVAQLEIVQVEMC